MLYQRAPEDQTQQLCVQSFLSALNWAVLENSWKQNSANDFEGAINQQQNKTSATDVGQTLDYNARPEEATRLQDSDIQRAFEFVSDFYFNIIKVKSDRTSNQ